MSTVPETRKDDWCYYGRWVQPTLSGVFWSYCMDTDAARAATPNHQCSPLLFLDGHTWVPKQDVDFLQTLAARLGSNKSKAREFRDNLVSVAKKFEKDHLALLDHMDLPLDQYVPRLFRTYRNMAGIWWTMFFSQIVEEYIIKSKIIHSVEELMKTVASLTEPTWLELQSREIMSLAREAKATNSVIKPGDLTEEYLREQPAYGDKIAEHVARYEWLGTHHWVGEPYTVAKCLDDIRDALRRGVRDISVAKDRPREVHPMIELVSAMAYWRTHCAEVTVKVVYTSRPKLIELAERLGLSYEDFTYLSFLEILDFLSGKEFQLPEHFEQRKQGYGCIVDDKGGAHMITGTKLRDRIASLKGLTGTAPTELKGVVGSKGPLVTGSVKVLISPDDFKKFKKGDILVAPETSPDFVTCMKQASAIITEVGGITSHAAIVARELGVPCIIGTSIATEVLKDGDMVEVNTETGVVTIKAQ